jgi:hypothetical protein
MPRQSHATTPRSSPLALFTAAIIAYIGYNIIATLVGIIARLPDVTTTHATTDQVPLGQVIFRPSLFSPAKWYVAVVAGTIYGVIGLAVVITGVAFLYHTFAERQRLTSPDRA